jgi:hypothetical protein
VHCFHDQSTGSSLSRFTVVYFFAAIAKYNRKDNRSGSWNGLAAPEMSATGVSATELGA